MRIFKIVSRAAGELFVWLNNIGGQARTEIDRLGFKFTQCEIAPLETKTSTILNLTAPKNLKQIRLFLGSVHYLGELNPNLTQLCHSL